MSEMRIGSLFSGVLSAASISDSNAPATPSASSARRMSGAGASSPPTGPESPATPTSARFAQMVALYQAGQSCEQIAKQFGVTRQAVWDVLRRRIEMRPRERYGSENHFYRGGTRAETCQRCGQTPHPFRDGRTAIQAHHPDYAKPLDVVWLCQPCHHATHREEVTPSEAPRRSISSAEASRSLAKTLASPDAEPDSSKEADRASSLSVPASQMSFYDPEGGSSLRTYPDSFPQTVAEIMPSFSRRWPTSGSTTSRGECWTHDSSESPNGGGVSSSLRDVLVEAVPERYFLSPRAAAGILRRAEKRGRELPAHLLAALQAVSTTPAPGEDNS